MPRGLKFEYDRGIIGVNTIPPDNGCEYFDRCTTCPLLRCYHEVADDPSSLPKQKESFIIQAIRETWGAGAHDSRFSEIWLSKRASLEGVPPAFLLDRYELQKRDRFARERSRARD